MKLFFFWYAIIALGIFTADILRALLQAWLYSRQLKQSMELRADLLKQLDQKAALLHSSGLEVIN